MIKMVAAVLFALILVSITGCGNQDNAGQAEESQTAVRAPDMDLHAAVVTDNLPVVRQHIKAGSDLEVKEPKHASTPLITAAARGKLEAAKLLIEAGAEIDYTNNLGSTALHAAAVFDHSDVADLLLDAGTDLNIRNHDGSTPLHAAAFFGRIEIVALLLEHDADTEILNKSGNTALEIVTMPFEEIIVVYDAMSAAFKSTGISLNYDEINTVRPKIAELLRQHKGK